MNESRSENKNITMNIVMNAILTALVFVATFINIKLPISINGGGLIHLGNIPLFVAAIIFGKKKAAISGAFGMSLFDIFSGFTIWAPYTFVIRGIMGYVMGYISGKKNGNSFSLNVLAILVGGVWMIFGYYITEVILYGNLYTPLASIVGDILQIVLGGLVALPIAKTLKKVKFKVSEIR